MTQQQLTTTFDDSHLDTATRTLCQETAKIATSFLFHARRSVEKGYELGHNLNEIKERLAYGQFMPYVASTGIPQHVANYWMRKVKAQPEIVDIYNVPQIEEPGSVDADQQDVQDILGEYGLEMSEADTAEHDMQQDTDAIHLSIFHQLAPERQQQITQVMMEVA